MTMTILDLSTGQAHGELRADVCILGAGAAGCYLARQLTETGCSVILVEAGGDATTTAEDLDMVPAMPSAVYFGANEGRAFGLGGSTARWGGALIPHTAADLRVNGDFAPDWQHVVQVARAQGRRVQATLGRTSPTDFALDAETLFGVALPDGSNVRAQSTLYLPFRRKNLRALLPDSPRLTLVLNAACTTWESTPTGPDPARITAVGLRSLGGTTLRAMAERFVVTAGAIESARMLLELNHSTTHPILPAVAETGQGLSDHLSAPIAALPLAEARRLAPRFQGSWMRSLRFLPGTSAYPRSFAHVVFHHDSAGIRLILSVLRGVQERRLPRLRAADAFGGAGDIACIAWAKLVRSRLHIPRHSRALLQLDMEQPRDLSNRISLTDERDSFGRRRAALNWRISERDLDAFSGLADQMGAAWPASLPRLAPLQGRSGHGSPYGAYHPTGTTRMGTDAGAVLTHDLQVRGCANLWSVSTGLLPSAGTANPTFTMLCFAQRLADHLAAQAPTR